LSQALTLYTTPVIYIFFDNLGNRFSRKRKKVAGESHSQEDNPPSQNNPPSENNPPSVNNPPSHNPAEQS
jgi:hypothetical protein